MGDKGISTLKHHYRFLTKWSGIRKLRREPLTIVLSPHLDDVFLSLNSFIISGKLGKNVIGINVFTLSDSSVDTRVNTDFGTLSSVSLARLKEEVDYSAYLKRKGINYMPLFLGFEDAAVETYYEFIARKGIKRVPQFFGSSGGKRTRDRYIEKRYSELMIDRAINPIIGQFNKNASTILAPMGIGNHIDHMLLRRFGDSLKDVARIGFYADIPYIYEYGYDTVEKLRNDVPETLAECEKAPFDANEKGRVFKSIYRSQYDGDMLKALRGIAKCTGEVVFWNR